MSVGEGAGAFCDKPYTTLSINCFCDPPTDADAPLPTPTPTPDDDEDEDDSESSNYNYACCMQETSLVGAMVCLLGF